MIVARAFPGPGSGRPGRLPLVREGSFHGTHVAGIAAGRSGTSSPGGLDHPSGRQPLGRRSQRLGRQLSRLQRPDAGRLQCEHARDRGRVRGGGARRDGRHQLLGRRHGDRSGERRDDRDGSQRVRRGSRAGGLRRQLTGRLRARKHRLAGHGAGRDHGRSHGQRARVRAFGDRAGRTAPANLHDMPFRTTLPVRAFQGWDTRNQTVVDIGSVRGTDGRPVDRQLCGVSHPNAFDTTLPRGSFRGTIALIERGGCAIVTKEIRALLGGAVGMILVDNRPGEPNDASARHPGRHDRRSRRRQAARLPGLGGGHRGCPVLRSSDRSCTRAGAGR